MEASFFRNSFHDLIQYNSFVYPGTWDNIEGGIWQLRPWRDWVQAKPGRRLIYSVVLLPAGYRGPAKGIAAGIPVSLEEGAKGTYNDHFRKLAENLVKYKLENSILRL